MFLTYLMLFVALCLSAVAAFYSIIGLTAIFAAAVWPIVIMGTILEAAKLVVTVWLHEYWQDVKLSMKIYLVPAVFTLMVITSMGIFGFLSKAHLDQTVPTGDVQAQVALIDEKITNERDTIANARTLLGQLDRAVSDLAAAGDREVKNRDGSVTVQTAAERSLQVRRQQARDRAALTKTIEDSQARIVKLQEEKAPFAKELRKVEAEVGPIKYIAALIYGDNPDANLLEKAVRWVIIILVIVFDPLAIMMLLAATESYRWERERRKTIVPVTPEPEPIPDSEPVPDSEPPVLGPKPDNPVEYKVLDDVSEPDYIEPAKVSDISKNDSSASNTEIEAIHDTDDTDNAIVADETNHRIKEAMKRWKAENPTKTLKEQRHRLELGVIDELPWMTLLADNTNDREINTGFGTAFPENSAKGDVFVRVDRLPNTVFKYNGQSWIEVDKNHSTSYTYDEAYIDYLIEQIDRGTYDPELLSSVEADLIAKRINPTDRT
jgi:hypothetical protein